MAIDRVLGLRAVLVASAVGIMSLLAGGKAVAQTPNVCDPGEAPDVIVGDLHQVMRYGRVGDITAFSVGTVSCNPGTCWLNWFQNTNQHPVIAQNMYRLKGGRFEQVGMSWLKHGFTALSDTLCFTDCQSTNGQHLGVHCSDPYSASLNGTQSNLGPRSQVNASTGFFPYPWSAPAAPATIGRRLQVHDADLDPALNSGAVYFVEGQYVAADDAAAGNGPNNASYRRINVTGTAPTFNIALTGSTQREQAAIRAWNDIDGGVTETNIDVPGDGRFILAAKATDIGGGFWHYEFAVQNINSDRSGGYFSVPIDPDATVLNIGFHDVDHHSGEPYSGDDWEGVFTGGAVTWSTKPVETDPNANALRWATMYNFRFDADVPPVASQVTLGLFKLGAPASVTASTVGPMTGPPDCNDNAIDDECDLDCGTPSGPCDVPGCGGSPDCDSNGTPDECQPDCDADGTPNGCELDSDADGDVDDCDNCVSVANADQADEDQDGIGDACDPDYCRSDVVADEFETEQGWTVGDTGDNATTGVWTRVDPVGTTAQPEDDHTPGAGAVCLVTGQGVAGGAVGDNDVDNGTTTLKSPVFALCGDAVVSYWRWYSNNAGSAPNADIFAVDISNNGGTSWVNAETVGPTGTQTSGGWFYYEFSVADVVTPTEQMRVRFVASDLGSGSIIEAAVDDFRVVTSVCLTDCNTNGAPDACDLAAGTSLDADGNGTPDDCQIPAAAVVSALSRKVHGPPSFEGDIAVNIAGQVGTGGVTSEPRNGGISELRLTFDVPPGQPESGSILIEEQGCGDPGYGPYQGFSSMNSARSGNELVLAFTPGLASARTYRFTIGTPVTSAVGQSLEIRSLIGDVDSDGFVWGTDRSIVIGVWTGLGFTVPTDLNLDGLTDATDRSIIVGVWTGGANCAP